MSPNLAYLVKTCYRLGQVSKSSSINGIQPPLPLVGDLFALPSLLSVAARLLISPTDRTLFSTWLINLICISISLYDGRSWFIITNCCISFKTVHKIHEHFTSISIICTTWKIIRYVHLRIYINFGHLLFITTYLRNSLTNVFSGV